MDIERRKDLLRQRRELHNDIEKLNKAKGDKLDYQRSISINDLLKRKRQQYKILTMLLSEEDKNE